MNRRRTLATVALPVLLIAATVLPALFAGTLTPTPTVPRSPDSARQSALGSSVDPLRGSAAQGVPRYHVASGSLTAPDRLGYVYGSPTWLAYDAVDENFWVGVSNGGCYLGPQNSVDVVNESGQVQASFVVGCGPVDVAVNDRSNLIYVTDYFTSNVTVLNGSYSCSTQCTTREFSVGTGAAPFGVAYDPTTNEVYVTNSGSDNVTVFNGTTGAHIADIPVGVRPEGIAYDPGSGQLFVADDGDYEVSVVAAATHVVVATLAAGTNPLGVAVDNRTDTVYVTNENSSNVTVISASTDTVVGSIAQVPSAPLQGIAYDSARDELWVGESYQSLGVINASAGRFAYVLNTDPSGVAYDPHNQTVCFTNSGNYTYECLSDPSSFQRTGVLSVQEAGLPTGQPWTVYVANGSAVTSSARWANLSVVPPWMYGWTSTITLQFAPSGAFVPSVATANVYVASGGGSYNVSFGRGASYPVVVNVTGLPVDAGWGVDVGGFVVDTVANSSGLPGLPNGTYSYQVDPPYDQTPTPATGNLTVAGHAVYIAILFNVTTYPVTFDEFGLPVGTTWYVNVTSGPMRPHLILTGSSGQANLSNGTYTFHAASANSNFTTANGGPFQVQGVGTTVAVGFVVVTYAVQFNATGLAPGANWEVTLGSDLASSNGTSLRFLEPSGLYRFAVLPPPGEVVTPSSGLLRVAHASPAPTVLVFASAQTYEVTFHERGLAAGTGWAVAVGGQVESSLTPNVTFEELNGTYGFVVLAVSGYVSPTGGVVGIHGSARTVNVTFTLVTYPVVIVEFGLAANTTWNATVTNLTRGVNVTESTNGTALVFFLPNGTYAIHLEAPGYNVTVTSPTFTVAGTRANGPSAYFARSPTNGEPQPHGHPPPGPQSANGTTLAGIPWYGWAAIAAVGATAAVALAVAFLAMRRLRPAR